MALSPLDLSQGLTLRFAPLADMSKGLTLAVRPRLGWLPMSAPAATGTTEGELQRAWWLRVPAVLLAPTAVFSALRDDSDDSVHARQEPIAAVVGVAGVGGVLQTSVARHILNEPGTSNVVVPVWAFLGGALYAIVLYWLFGALLYGGARALGSLGSYRRARHILGFACVPLALSLVTLWPVRIAVYGGDLFRTGGDDFGRGDAVFGAVGYAFLAWTLLLVVLGVRAVHGWSWIRSLAAVALGAVLPALVVAGSHL